MIFTNSGVVMPRNASNRRRRSWEIPNWDRGSVTPENRSPLSSLNCPDSDIPSYKTLKQQQQEADGRRVCADSKITPWQRFMGYWVATQAARQSAEKATAYSALIAGPVLAGVGLVSALSILLAASSPDAVMMVVSNVPVSAGLTAGLTVVIAAVLFAIVCLATYAVEHRRRCVNPLVDKALEMIDYPGSSGKTMRAVSVLRRNFGQEGNLTVTPLQLTFDNNEES